MIRVWQLAFVRAIWMAYAQVLVGLFETGQLNVPRPSPVDDTELRELTTVLTGFEREYRKTLPDGLPEFSPSAAIWAGVNFVRASQCAVFRDIAAEEFPRLLVPKLEPSATEKGKNETQQYSASTHFSVDVVFRFLPGLVDFAKARAEADPLVTQLIAWCQDWPLSSVGITLPAVVNVDAIIDNAGLRRMYVDRILAVADKSRLDDPRVRQAVKPSWGLFPQLGGRISEAIAELEATAANSTATDSTAADTRSAM